MENNGELVAIDSSGMPYYTSGPVQGMPGFKLVLTDDGKIAVFDATN